MWVELALFRGTCNPNGWFWWAIGDTGAQFVAHRTNTFPFYRDEGLNNILWLMPYGSSRRPLLYPGGASVVDGDTYGTNQYTPVSTATMRGDAARCPSRCTRPD